MSTIKIEDVQPKDYNKNLKRFIKKLEELTVIEEELKIEGFVVKISKI